MAYFPGPVAGIFWKNCVSNVSADVLARTLPAKLTAVRVMTMKHYGDVKWPSWRLDLPVNPVFVQHFVQTNNKDTSKVRVTESTGDRWLPAQRDSTIGVRWIPRTKGQ